VPRSALVQICTQAEVWVLLLKLWLLPIGQSILHDHPASARPLGFAALAGWGVVAAVLSVRARRAPPGSAAALGAFTFTLAVAWLVPSSAVPLLETMSEHRSYLAGFALAVAVAASLPSARGAWSVVPVLFVATVLRNFTWADEVKLWAEATAGNPTSARAWYGYGDALRLARRFADAEPAYSHALALDPTNADARISLGVVQAERGDEGAARTTWEAVLKADPHACAAHNDLAGLDLRAGKLRAAEAGYESALAWCPDDPLAHINLANLAYASADVRKAAFHYQAYLTAAPSGPWAEQARTRLGELLASP
jgi:tetratricopeptide (TPR) repeat protein